MVVTQAVSRISGLRGLLGTGTADNEMANQWRGVYSFTAPEAEGIRPATLTLGKVVFPPRPTPVPHRVVSSTQFQLVHSVRAQ